MRRRTSSVCVYGCLAVLGVAATLGGCAAESVPRVARANQHRTYRLASGDALGMQILRNDSTYSASDESSSFATVESAEQPGK